jgi:polygalacturonase
MAIANQLLKIKQRLRDRMKNHRLEFGLGQFAFVLLLFCFVAQAAAQTEVRPQLPTIPQRKFLLTDFGAIGDGKTLNTDAFRKAIAACRKAGGGEVVVPAGTFVTAPFALTDNMALVLERGATIRGSEHFNDYERTNASGHDTAGKASVSRSTSSISTSRASVSGRLSP